MDSSFVLFLITVGVLATIFGVMYVVGRNYGSKKKDK